MDNERLLYLLQQYLSDKATREEVEEFFVSLECPESDKPLTNFLKERWNDASLIYTYSVTPNVDQAWQKLRAAIQATSTKPDRDPFSKQKKSRTAHLKETYMLKNYLKIALRSILRHKAYSFLNIAGLTVGLSASILVLLWVQNERSYDRFHRNAGQIYRITTEFGDTKYAANSAGMPAGLKAAIPFIKNTVRLSGISTVLFETGNKRLEQTRVFYADPSFLDVFSFPLLKGDRNTALTRVDGVLITRETATKYFGKEDPIGKILRKDNSENVVVTGVFENIPANSDLQFDVILPMASLARTNTDLQNNVWDNFNFYNYVQLDKTFDPTAENLKKLEKQMARLFQPHSPGTQVSFQLQPLTSIHLAPERLGDLPGHGNAQYVSLFFIIAILILIVACINFMNLATARSARRAKEIGLRKVAGAVRGQLILQFLSESVFISFLSLSLAVGIVHLILPAFNELADRKLAIDLLDLRLWLSLLGIALLTGLVSGSYPALFLSGFNPIKVLKGARPMGGNLLFRDVLVVIQFTVSIVLIIGTIVIYNQLSYIKDRNPGFEKANLLYTPMTGDILKNQQALRDALKQNPLTSDFTITSDLPTDLRNWTVSADWAGKDPRAQPVISAMYVNEDFTHVFRMTVLTGRSFSPSFMADSNNYMVNEKMVSLMGTTADAAIGKTLTFRGNKGTIVGVVKDFNFKPVQQAIEPLVLPFNRSDGIVIVRTLPGKTKATIAALSQISQRLNPAYPFKLDFLDQGMASLYKDEQQMGNIFNLFALFGIFISCLGLYGLAAFMAEQRTKEIGVRKVLGASVLKLVYLMATDMTRLVLIAIVIAIPLSWYAVNRWLTGFAYHTNVSWLVFFMSSLSVLAIAWLTVSYESIKAAITNPIKSLRTE
jgi:putative ABC transport system permease protein